MKNVVVINNVETPYTVKRTGGDDSEALVLVDGVVVGSVTRGWLRNGGHCWIASTFRFHAHSTRDAAAHSVALAHVRSTQ